MTRDGVREFATPDRPIPDRTECKSKLWCYGCDRLLRRDPHASRLVRLCRHADHDQAYCYITGRPVPRDFYGPIDGGAGDDETMPTLLEAEEAATIAVERVKHKELWDLLLR